MEYTLAMIHIVCGVKGSDIEYQSEKSSVCEKFFRAFYRVKFCLCYINTDMGFRMMLIKKKLEREPFVHLWWHPELSFKQRSLCTKEKKEEKNKHIQPALLM